jgi:hypothetical protein
MIATRVSRGFALMRISRFMGGRFHLARRLGSRGETVVEDVSVRVGFRVADKVERRSGRSGDRPSPFRRGPRELVVALHSEEDAIGCRRGQPGRKTNERAENRRSEVGDHGAHGSLTGSGVARNRERE